MSLLIGFRYPILNLHKYIDMSSDQNTPKNGSDEKPGWLETVRRQVGSLHYGVVQIVVHDSQVTQIEKTERIRLEKPRAQTILAGKNAGA